MYFRSTARNFEGQWWFNQNLRQRVSENFYSENIGELWYLKIIRWSYRNIRPDVFCKTGVLWNFAKFTGQHLCQSLLFNKVVGLSPGEISKIFKNTFLYRTPLVAAFEVKKILLESGALIEAFYASDNWTLPPFVKIAQSFILMQNA